MEGETSTQGVTTPSRALMLAGVLAIVAGLIHILVAPEHFSEATEAGLFMVTVAAAQIASGILLVTRPSRTVLIAALVGSLLVGAIYIVSRTSGLPVGAHPWSPEPVGQIDLISKVTELALVGLLAYQLVFAAGRRTRETPAPKTAS